MPQSTASLEHLFERRWRPGRPFRPRLSPMRRHGMFLLLCFLLALIFGYGYLTDAKRVKRMCEAYLSQLLGGKVQVGHAALSIFEGLRLDRVKVQVDDGSQPDSTLFEVASVSLKYNPESILSGKLEATEIVAIDPVVSLCENLDLKRWNYQRVVLPPQRVSTSQPHGRRPMVLPQIKLRNGFIRYSQLHDGEMKPLGTMAIDGSVTPGETFGNYLFRIQSRGGGSDLLGPVVSGEFASGSREVGASLENFQFGPDIKAVLPSLVRQWLNDHQLAGRVSIPHMHVIPDPSGGRPKFNVEMQMEGVQLAVDPNEWFSRVEQEQVKTLRGAFDLMRFAGMNGQANRAATTAPGAAVPVIAGTPVGPSGFVDALETTVMPAPVILEGVKGTFVFTQDGIQISSLVGSVERNEFEITGHIDGYAPSVPAKLQIAGSGLRVPRVPHVINSMPRVVRDVYTNLKPEGVCNLRVTIDRREGGQRPVVDGRVDFVEGSITCDQFAYPLRVSSGAVVFGPDPEFGEKLQIVNVVGHGVPGGPNENRSVTINGQVAPLNGDAEVTVHIAGKDISSEPAITAALPHEARAALKTLDPSGKGDYPTFRGDITAYVHREAGPYKPFSVVTTLDLSDAAGTYEGFAYPLEHIAGRVVIGPRFAKIEHCTAHKGDADVTLNGELTWDNGKPVTPDLSVLAHNVPIDATLMKAISPSQREWLEKLGVGGRIDVNGTVTRKGATTRPSDVDVVLDIGLNEGSLLPAGSKYAVSDVSGKLHLGGGKVDFKDFKGKRGEGTLAGDGTAVWAGDHPEVTVSGSAQNLLLEPALYDLLPKSARGAWDSVQPQGTIDAVLKWGGSPATTQATRAVASVEENADPLPPATTQPYAVTIRPRKLAVTLKAMPYRLTDLNGVVEVSPAGTELKNILAKHGTAALAISGTSTEADHGGWTLNVMGRDLPADPELHNALPPGLAGVLQSMKLQGKISFDFPKLTYQANDAGAATQPIAKTGVPAGADLGIGGTIWFTNCSLDVGVPVTDMTAVLKLETAVLHGKLAGLRGSIQAPTLKVSGREAKNFYAELFKPAQADALRLDKIQAWLAGGELAGQVDVAFPENGASRYALGLVLRNADVPQLTGEQDQVKGQVTASLAMEGAWNDSNTRRGRGDVRVSGKEMYRIPLMLGLLQITNLGLPISSPFNEANARYSVDGPKITFETIELRANNMIMQGSGWLNFDNKQVRMTFTTDNPNWPKLPIVSDLLNGAKHELLQIHVAGTVQEPKVSGSMMNTLTTTVDQVFKAGDAPDSDGNVRRHR